MFVFPVMFIVVSASASLSLSLCLSVYLSIRLSLSGFHYLCLSLTHTYTQVFRPVGLELDLFYLNFFSIFSTPLSLSCLSLPPPPPLSLSLLPISLLLFFSFFHFFHHVVLLCIWSILPPSHTPAAPPHTHFFLSDRPYLKSTFVTGLCDIIYTYLLSSV